MAEARLAVAFQFAVTDDGEFNIHFDKDVVRYVFRALGKAVKRKVKAAKHSLLKWHFPATPLAWVLFFLALAAARIGEHQPTLGLLGKLEQALPGLNRASPYIPICIGVTILTTLLWMLWSVILRLILRALLTYRGILFERKPSLKSKIWAGIVKLVTFGNPTLYSFQQSLPRLPVPSLDDTLDRHLESVRPIFSEEKFKRVQDLTEEFRNGEGSKLQRYLVLKSWWANNYVTDWWNNFVYLKSREPLMINSNFYGMMQVLAANQFLRCLEKRLYNNDYCKGGTRLSIRLQYCKGSPFYRSTHQQISKAANLIHASFLYRKLIEKERLKPLMVSGLVPLCSTQYKLTFNTTRIPHKEHDEFFHQNYSNHVVVHHKGRFFKLTLYSKGELLKPKDIERQLDRIVEDTYTPSHGEDHIAALTGNDRKVWAEAREEFFSTGINHHSLHVIESAAFYVVLADCDASYDKDDATRYNEFGGYCLHGSGSDIWFDKSFSLIIFKNGKVGLNCEHAWADAPIISQYYEWATHCENYTLGYDDNGRCKGEAKFSLNPPERLQWELPTECVEIIETANEKNLALINDLDISILVHNEFGKGVVKKCGVSPDAFLQIGYQLANYKDVGSFSLTYESAMTRLYRDGRTETVRPCTLDSCAFVKAMLDPSVSKEERKRLFITATKLHSVNIRKAMSAQGVDRHLFCLYVVSKYLEVDSPFLNEILSEPWKLSTSQTAVVQMGLFDFTKEPLKVPGGGGFGPVADDGYGLCYVVTEHVFIIHITSKKSSSLTNSTRFARNIRESFQEIKALFD